MAYHATVNPVDIDGWRIARVEKIDWNDDGTPSFPRPHGFDFQFEVPSGQSYVWKICTGDQFDILNVYKDNKLAN